MTLYALEIGIDYSGHDVAGIYSTIELARAAAAELSEKQYGDSLRVSEIVLDAPPDGTYGGLARWWRNSNSNPEQTWKRCLA